MWNSLWNSLWWLRYLLFVNITQSVFRLPLLNDEYTLPPPAGKESYCHSRMCSGYVLLGRQLKSLRCVPVRLLAKTQETWGDTVGSVGMCSLVSFCCVRAFKHTSCYTLHLTPQLMLNISVTTRGVTVSVFVPYRHGSDVTVRHMQSHDEYAFFLRVGKKSVIQGSIHYTIYNPGGGIAPKSCLPTNEEEQENTTKRTKYKKKKS